jgi:DNA gyrase subunit B
MRELIEKGHIFIAQPPLYKVTRGREEVYMANDKELSAFVIRKATDEKTVQVSETDGVFSGNELNHLMHAMIDYDSYMKSIERLGLDRPTVELLLVHGLSDRHDFESVEKLEGLVADLEELGHHVVNTAKDEDHELYELVLRSGTHGQREFRINFELVQTVASRPLLRLRPDVSKLDHRKLIVLSGSDERELGSKEELLQHLMESGKKGLNIQRYKGLGEMNPDQLWETTMDPERRSVLEVRIEDATEADMLFSVLMGDAVEPRRQFIEQNALEVQNLDV